MTVVSFYGCIELMKIEDGAVPSEFIKPKKHIPLKKVFFISAYLSMVPVFIVFVMLFSLYAKYDVKGYISRQNIAPHYQALPENSNSSVVSTETDDARAEALEELFTTYESPLKGHGNKIVEEADKHNIDYRLLPSIAMQESTMCKKIIKDSHNCWGFGIYGGKVTKFESFDLAIETVSKTLAKKYVQRGLVEPHEIVTKYTPSDDGKWVNAVTTMMDYIKSSL